MQQALTKKKEDSTFLVNRSIHSSMVFLVIFLSFFIGSFLYMAVAKNTFVFHHLGLMPLTYKSMASQSISKQYLFRACRQAVIFPRIARLSHLSGFAFFPSLEVFFFY